MEFKKLIRPLPHICWLPVFFCGAANAYPAEITSAINDITVIMSEAENLDSWPDGYCKKNL